MRETIIRVGLVLLAIGEGYPGYLATVNPHRFYRTFPGHGHHWLTPLGPYNEHLVTDLGGLFLAVALLAFLAAVFYDARTARIALAAWLVFSIEHLVFHARHTDVMSHTDNVAGLASLAASAGLAAVLFVLTFMGPRRGVAEPSPARGPQPAT
jgi:hypothetical protein